MPLAADECRRLAQGLSDFFIQRCQAAESQSPTFAIAVQPHPLSIQLGET